jgi:hypothetical protein
VTIRVHCAQPALRAAVEAWLADSRLLPPRPLELSIEVANAAWTGEDGRRVLRQPLLTYYYGEPGNLIRLVWRDGLGHAVVAPGSSRAEVRVERSLAERPESWLRPFLLAVVTALLRRVGWNHIHAATAADPTGRGWLIAGDAHSGKSTTAALLATRGWAVGTDDTAFLVDGAQPIEALAWREPIALREGGYDLLRLDGGLKLPQRRKTGFFPEELGGRWAAKVVPDVVAIAALHDGPTRLEPLRSSLAVADLLSWSLLFIVEPEGAQRHLELVTRLAAQARCYRLFLGRDIFGHPDLLTELAP